VGVVKSAKAQKAYQLDKWIVFLSIFLFMAADGITATAVCQFFYCRVARCCLIWFFVGKSLLWQRLGTKLLMAFGCYCSGVKTGGCNDYLPIFW